MEKTPDKRSNELIIGRNSVLEAIKSGRAIDTLMVVRGDRSGSIGKIIGMCRENGVVVKEVDPRKLDYMCGHSNHQGVIAYAAAHEYAELEDIFSAAEAKGFSVTSPDEQETHAPRQRTRARRNAVFFIGSI